MTCCGLSDLIRTLWMAEYMDGAGHRDCSKNWILQRPTYSIGINVPIPLNRVDGEM